MLSFELKFNLDKIVKFHKEKLMKIYDNSDVEIANVDNRQDNVENQMKDGNSSDPVIIGQELNNLILFTWNTSYQECENTFIGLYNMNFEESKLVYVSNQKLNIINATVDNDLSLIGFSIVEQQICDDATSNCFKSYIAEITPQNQLLCLAVSSRLQKLKFLSPQSSSGKISHLLLMQHAVSITIYHIPLANIDNQFLINAKPTHQKIVRKFLWCQFDMCTQRLYYIELLAQDVEDVYAFALFNVVEFKSDGDFEYILNFPLPINFKMDYIETLKYDLTFPFSNIVSSSIFNMVALSAKSGTFYLCHQHAVKIKSDSDLETPDTLSTDSSKESSAQVIDHKNGSAQNLSYHITYTVCCVHAAYKLLCASLVKKTEFLSMNEDPILFFNLFQDYLVVYLPNTFLYLLDTGIEHEPGFNLLISDQEIIPKLPMDCSLSNYQYFMSQSNATNLIFDRKNQVVYDMKLSLKNIFRYFLRCDAPTRLSLVHSFVVHFNEKRLIRKFLDKIIQDPANVETKDLLKEFLLATTYHQMKKVVAYSSDAKIFPFTTQELFRGQIERDASGNRIIHLSYKEFDDNLKKQLLKVLGKTGSVFWKHFYNILAFEIENKGKRFSVRALPQNKSHVTNSSVKKEANQLSFRSNFKEVRSRAHSVFSSSSQLPLANTDAEISLDIAEIKNINEVVFECMIGFLVKAHGNELKGKARNLCKEYTLQQNRSILLLWKIILKTFNYARNPSLLFSKDLTSEPDTSEILLFQILKRLIIATSELYHPGFPGMNYLYALLALRCLTREQFLQYVESSAIDIHPDFALHVVNEVNDVDEAWKFKLLSYMSRENVYHVLQKWQSPLASRYMAQFQLLKVSSQPVFLSEDISDQFVPVETLLETLDKSLHNGNIEDERKNQYVRDLVKKTSLISIEKF